MGDGFRQFSIGLTKPEVSSIQYWIDETRDFVNWIDETSSACGEDGSIPSIGLTNSLTCPPGLVIHIGALLGL